MLVPLARLKAVLTENVDAALLARLGALASAK